jgi:hypothetical protein
VTGLEYNEVTRHHHQRLDKQKATQSLYKKKTEKKRKRRKLLYSKIAAGNLTAKESRKDGYNYGPGLMAPNEDDEGVAAVDAETSKEKKLVVGCDKCGKSDHKMTRSMKCYSTNPKNVFFTGIKETLSSDTVPPTVIHSLPPPTPGISISAFLPTDEPIFDPINCLASTDDLMNGKCAFFCLYVTLSCTPDY